MKTKHTEGPWIFFEGKVTIGVCRNTPGDQGSIAVLERSRPEAAANARLMAASPKLLSAAHAAAKLIRGSGFTDNTAALRELNEAIAEAEA